MLSKQSWMLSIGSQYTTILIVDVTNRQTEVFFTVQTLLNQTLGKIEYLFFLGSASQYSTVKFLNNSGNLLSNHQNNVRLIAPIMNQFTEIERQQNHFIIVGTDEIFDIPDWLDNIPNFYL